MTFVPLFSSPCDLAVQTPAMVAELLNLRGKLARDRNEASVTDMLVACFLKLAAAEVTAIVPYEPETGADLDLLVVNRDITRAVQFRLQTKKLYKNGVKDWRNRSYKELDHPHGTDTQASMLVRSSAHEKVPTIPLYVFYNDQETCDLSGGEIEGISLADGITVRRIVKELVDARPKRLQSKRIGKLKDLFFPFSTILCPPVVTGEPPISPDACRQAVERALVETRRRWQANLPEDEFTYALESPDRRSLAKAPILQLDKRREPLRDRIPIRSSIPELKAASTRESILPMSVVDALARRNSEGVAKGPLRRTKLVLRP